jgi:hypothetical protein
MTLYHYVRTKEDLVALMDDTLMGSVLVPADELPTQWRKALHVIAMSSYRSFMRHPWCLDALRGARFGPNGMRHFEQSLKAVSTAPFDLQGKLDALGIVDDYVFGHVLRVVENVDQKDFAEGRPSKAVVKYTEQMLATGEFPHIEALLLKGEAPGAAWGRIARFMNDPERFVRGLDALLDGLEARARRSR